MAGCGLKLTSAQLTILRTIKASMKRQKYTLTHKRLRQLM
jgi:hypothetical protein